MTAIAAASRRPAGGSGPCRRSRRTPSAGIEPDDRPTAELELEVEERRRARARSRRSRTSTRSSPIRLTRPLAKVFGKRVIVVGGGAQVAQVALGAVSEADRHNLRGERISVDTIPLVGEEAIASAVRAVADLPRARLLVLAGSIMGGEISRAAEELRAVGIPIIALNMVGSITDHVDLVVSDPVQAGTMAVMAVADTATFDLDAPARPEVLSASDADRDLERQLAQGPAGGGREVAGARRAGRAADAGDEARRRRRAGDAVPDAGLRAGPPRRGPLERRRDPDPGRAPRTSSRTSATGRCATRSAGSARRSSEEDFDPFDEARMVSAVVRRGPRRQPVCAERPGRRLPVLRGQAALVRARRPLARRDAARPTSRWSWAATTT